MGEQKNPNIPEDSTLLHEMNQKVPIKGYIFLCLGILIFSGIFASFTGVLNILDFSTLLGKFGTIAEGASAGFRGSGGTGAREGFVFALTALPAVALSIGLINMIDGQSGLRAAQKLLTPLLRPLLGIPGWCGLALIGSLQNTDAGAALTGALVDEKLITEKEHATFAGFLFSASAPIGQYFSTGIMLFPYIEEAGIASIMPFVVIMIGKVFTCNLMRLYVNLTERRGKKNGAEK